MYKSENLSDWEYEEKYSIIKNSVTYFIRYTTLCKKYISIMTK